MNTFILMPGANFTCNGLVYKQGEAINTNMNLKSMFPHRVTVAPKGVEGTRWPLHVNDVKGAGKFAVIANQSRTSFRIVNAEGVIVPGCACMSLKSAIAKYEELTGAKKGKEEKPAEVKKTTPVPPKDEDDGDDDDGEDSDSEGDESDSDGNDDDGEDSAKDEDSDEDDSSDGDDDDGEEDDEVPPPKKNKKNREEVKPKKGKKKNRNK